MDPTLSGLILDPSNYHELSIDAKRTLVRELSKKQESAAEKLQTWSRKDLLEILCAEIGKDRKYTGLTKQKLIENIFKILAEKKSGRNAEDMDSTPNLTASSSQNPCKRPRKNDNPSRLPVATSTLSGNDGNEVVSDIRYCQNLACRATLKLEDAFCKRCSCCICHKYDENKDPSLWLFCNSETLSSSCGMSCHLECALKHERAGIVKNGKCTKLDGSYYCVSCGKANDLIGCWKKQLLIAKDARRVDVLCHRILLSHRILTSTEKYKTIHQIVDTALKKLEMELGPVNGLPNMARGIVNRLSVGAEVQKLCACAIESLETMHSGPSRDALVQQTGAISSNFIKFEDVSPTSVALVLCLEDVGLLLQQITGFTLWHRQTDSIGYPEEPTCTLLKPKSRALITDLTPSMDYVFKVVSFNETSELGMWEVGVTTEGISKDDLMVIAPETTSALRTNCHSPKANSSGLSNPSEGDESNNNNIMYADLNKSPESYFDCCEKPEILDSEKLTDDSKKYEVHQKSDCGGTISGTDVVEPEEVPGSSGSALDEEPNSTIQTECYRDSTTSMENNQASDTSKSENESNTPIVNDVVIVPFVCPDQSLPTDPGAETSKDASGWTGKAKQGISLLANGFPKPDQEPGSSSKKRVGGKLEELFVKDEPKEGAYEYCVKVIRWLECERHIESAFRVKFLTWFSLQATLQEKKVVKVYVDTLIDDPASLAGQLVDTFSDAIYSKRPPPVPSGFCVKLWH